MEPRHPGWISFSSGHGAPHPRSELYQWHAACPSADNPGPGDQGVEFADIIGCAGAPGTEDEAPASIFWERRGFLTEGRGWLQQALALEPQEATHYRAIALYSCGKLALRQRDYAAAQSLLEQSRASEVPEHETDGVQHGSRFQNDGVLSRRKVAGIYGSNGFLRGNLRQDHRFRETLGANYEFVGARASPAT